MQLWSHETNLYLFTPAEFEKLPDGTKLESINGCIATKGTDRVDLDTRYGHIAYGVRDPDTHPLKHLFLLFKLS